MPNLKKNKKQIGGVSKRWAYGALLLIVVLTSAARIRLLDVPLERDEGEYAYAGQLILQGIAPYDKVYNMKLPGIYAAYAVILAVFGESGAGIHLGLLVVNGGIIFLLFLLGRRLFDPFTGVIAAAVYAFLSLGPSVQGFSANAEQFVLLPAMAGILMLLRALETKGLSVFFLSGLLFGLAIITKQHGTAFAVFALLYLFSDTLRRRPVAWLRWMKRSGILLAGAAVPFGAVCLILLATGLFQTFWYWTFDYASLYVSSMPIEEGMKNFEVRATHVVSTSGFLWLLAALGLTALAWDGKAAAMGFFVLGFLFFSFLAVCPGLYFRPHYFQFLLPAAGLLAGLAAGSVARQLKRLKRFPVPNLVPGLLVLLLLAQAVYYQRLYLFELEPNQISRLIYHENPFPESLKIAEYIQRHSRKTDTVAVLGSEPQIYFYSGRHSATGHIYTYPLMEQHDLADQMQQEMIAEIEEAAPRFMVYVHVSLSWWGNPDSNLLILRWFKTYVQEHYEQVGLVEIDGRVGTRYYWDDEAAERTPAGTVWLSVHRRKD